MITKTGLNKDNKGVAHAEGVGTEASGIGAHAEGGATKAVGRGAHAEGQMTEACGDAAHAEGNGSLAKGFSAHAEGVSTNALGAASHAEGSGTIAEGEQGSHAEGSGTQAMGESAHAEGRGTVSGGVAAHAEGFLTLAEGEGSHSEGGRAEALGQFAHAEGNATKAEGRGAHAEGSYSIALGSAAHSEGSVTIAIGASSHAEGVESIAAGVAAHSEGAGSEALGMASHAEGLETMASGDFSHSEGKGTNTKGFEGAHIMGKYGDATNDYSWFMANGSDSSNKNISARILNCGDAEFQSVSAYAAGAHLAGMFETVNGKRIDPGYFVTLEGDKIRIAKGTDDYILGITSANPAFLVGSAELYWKDKYQRDDWGMGEYYDMIIPTVTDKDGKLIKLAKVKNLPKVNPKWHRSNNYVPRSQRAEWVAVGLIGTNLVRDVGNCEVDGYCRPNEEGIAEAAREGYRVLKRVGPNQILIFFR